MTNIAGLGGIFFKSSDPEALRAWYARHLKLEFDDYGSVIFHPDKEEKTGRERYIVLSPFKEDTSYFQPSEGRYMLNFRVNDLDGLLHRLAKEGVKIMPESEDGEFGRFAWIIDLEGHKIELWQPPLKDGGIDHGQILRKTFSGRIIKKSLTIGVVVGTLLNLINQGGAIWGQVEAQASFEPVKFILTYLVPFGVASFVSWLTLWEHEKH